MNEGDRSRSRWLRGSWARPLAASLAAAALPLVLAACAREKGESQLAWLQSELDHEFPDRAAPIALDPASAQQERLTAAAAGPNTQEPPPPVFNPTATTPPPLPAEPAARATSVEEPSANSARASIRIVGSGKARGPGRAADDHIEITIPGDGPTPAPATASPAPPTPQGDPSAKQQYDRGMALLNARDYDRALEAFGTYLIKWPDQPGAEGAMYWSAEAYLAKGEFVEATEQFETTLNHFPAGTKTPDALLKLGICAQRLGNPDLAKSYFARLAHDFPRSDAARRIPGDHATPL
jgi:tol-pal system protein YbgF